MTSSRPSLQKSMSMSGIEMRSRLRNRSNRRSCFSGSTSVMPSAYATREPAALPRPGPTGIPCSLLQRMKSHTMRKYETNPMCSMTEVSSASRASTAAESGLPYSRAAPSRQSRRKYDVGSSPAGGVNFGRWNVPRSSFRSQRAAMSSVVRGASSRSRNSAYIGSLPLKQTRASCFRRFWSFSVLPMPMHMCTSWAARSSSST